MFLLTDNRPKLLAGGRGLALERDEQANDSLLTDLRSDKGMSWVPDQMWFTYLRVHATAAQLGYDLAVSTRPDAVPALAATGVSAKEARPVVAHSGRALWPLGAAVAAGVATFGIAGWFDRRRRTLAGVAL